MVLPLLLLEEPNGNNEGVIMNDERIGGCRSHGGLRGLGGEGGVFQELCGVCVLCSRHSGEDPSFILAF